MSQDSLLQRVKRVRISDTVVDQIITLIEDGRLKVGDQLPGERELVEQLQVGRATVREALRMLEAQGVIEVRPGKGAFITGDVGTLSGQDAIKLWLKEHAGEILDLLEIREALERRAVVLAAKNKNDNIIAELQAALEETERCMREQDMERLGYYDHQFHKLLAKASGNSLLSQIIDAVSEAMLSPRRSIQRLPGRGQQSLEEHYAIFNAVKNGDSDAAEQAVINHITSVRAAIVTLSLEGDITPQH